MTTASISIQFTLNERAVQAQIAPNRLLIDLVRDHFRLKGTKRSCDMEVCGACTVLLNGLPVSSCTTLAADADGGTVITIEGLTPSSGLSAIQEAFVAHGAAQCGYCTPGFIVAVTALLESNPCPGDAEIKHYLRGNLCRCTGYIKIMEAVRWLAAMSKHTTNDQTTTGDLT